MARAAGASTTRGSMSERTRMERVALGAGGTAIAGAQADSGWQLSGPNGRSHGGCGCRSEWAGACVEDGAMSMRGMSVAIRARAAASVCLTQATPLAANANWLHSSTMSQTACRRRHVIIRNDARDVRRAPARRGGAQANCGGGDHGLRALFNRKILIYCSRDRHRSEHPSSRRALSRALRRNARVHSGDAPEWRAMCVRAAERTRRRTVPVVVSPESAQGRRPGDRSEGWAVGLLRVECRRLRRDAGGARRAQAVATRDARATRSRMLRLRAFSFLQYINIF